MKKEDFVDIIERLVMSLYEHTDKVEFRKKVLVLAKRRNINYEKMLFKLLMAKE